jgi:carboxymethylenebutenolidase
MREELLSLIPEAPELTRRTFVLTSLTTGFALAVQPIQAQTQIITDTNGLTAGEVKIPTKDV